MNDHLPHALPSVLIVDDERSVRYFLRRWLGDLGYPVLLAASATEALDAMQEEPVPIMLCDVLMPVHDGLWLAEQVRARWPETVIIMATGDQSLGTIMDSQRLGAVDYLTKPFGRELLLQALRRAEDRLTANHIDAPAAS